MSVELALIYVGAVFRETPLWAYAVLIALILLGARRLKARARRLRTAFIAPAVFAVWSLAGAVAYAQAFGSSAVMVWTGAVCVGCATAFWLPGKAGQPQADGRIWFPATVGPLITYMAVFFSRFGLEVWAGFQPDRRGVASLLALVLSAFMTGRTSGELARLIRLRAALRA